ncbi:HK97 family phage prohead protease [Paracoccus haeundaensis]|uniref:HK97 family phage prohead protease n=1 Tax=Paracoccus haeundaensis TaxID=225362 RepID=A0A5C4RBL0_9RHOB|nr:HK97 family phage prohead protease [Paracoccus haeundaensis]TNH41285.1 HK97 family phage prohead protease [Paracoccus haeundaensis]
MDRSFIETKILADNDGAITALAWPFGSPDRVGDMITKGAFASAKLPIPMLFGHDANDPIGVWDGAEERDDGLHLKGRLLVGELARAREVQALVRAGAVRGISIGFVTLKALPRPPRGRSISSLDLLEASLVTLPCHPGARVTAAKDAVSALRLAAAIQRAAAHLSIGKA